VYVATVPSPSAVFSASPDTIMGGEFVSFLNKNSGATKWYWTFGDGGSAVDSFTYYQYNVPGSYFVTLVVNNGFCSDTARDTVLVTEGIYVPNVFTPNNDGVNDVFHVTAGGLKTYNIEIFNRWGEKVFEANSPNIDWAGSSMAGVDESDGTYYYMITATDYKGKSYNRNGYVQLIR
ncbi:MAG TPA: gliding motility-associated C-terminal domain-containing protein, partial [Bacteroidia bacterium]|nr:gliding motility-associated C-terminal domain-containing protein [Bacteroidia bacterium]